jgi:hypothetical protein
LGSRRRPLTNDQKEKNKQNNSSSSSSPYVYRSVKEVDSDGSKKKEQQKKTVNCVIWPSLMPLQLPLAWFNLIKISGHGQNTDPVKHGTPQLFVKCVVSPLYLFRYPPSLFVVCFFLLRLMGNGRKMMTKQIDTNR